MTIDIKDFLIGVYLDRPVAVAERGAITATVGSVGDG